MKINVTYVGRKHFKDHPKAMKSWRFYFRRYYYVKGFNLRIFGVHFNIREKKALEKILSLAGRA